VRACPDPALLALLIVFAGCNSGQETGFDGLPDQTGEDMGDGAGGEDVVTGDPVPFDFSDDGPAPDPAETTDPATDPDADTIDETELPPESICYESTLSSREQTESDGFTVLGGTWRDGGFAVDATGDRLEKTLVGDFSEGTIEFEALDLLRVIPHDPDSHGCERFILNLNIHERDDPEHTRTVMANMTSDCADQPRGNLRVIFFGDGGFCCMDTARLPDTSDGSWHHLKLTWDRGAFTLYVDGSEWAGHGYSSGTVGLDPYIWFGSESAAGDESHAVFRNLRICNTVY